MTSAPARNPFVNKAILFEGSLAILAWVLGWWLSVAPLGRGAWTLNGIWLGIAACLPMVLAFVLILASPFPPFRRISELCDDVLRPMFMPCTVFDLALLSFLAGLGEEMLFRAVLQTWFALYIHDLAG